MIHDAGAKLYACKATVDMFGLKMEDFCDQVEKVLTVGEFYDISAGAHYFITQLGYDARKWMEVMAYLQQLSETGHTDFGQRVPALCRSDPDHVHG